MQDIEIVFFDLETTGFTKDDEIIQIAARSRDSSFNVYITPTRAVHWKASEVTGLQLRNGNLYLHNQRVHSIPARNAFINFMNYLRRMNKSIVLVAHNCFGFDMPRILKLANELEFLKQFKKIIHGFSDSLVILKSVLSQQRAGKGKFTLRALVQDFVANHEAFTNNLHNAKCDVKLLQLLVFNSGLNISEEQVIEKSKSIDQYYKEQEIKVLVKEAKTSLQCYKNNLSSWIISKMAKTRIDRNLLRHIFQNNGFEGIKKLFSKNFHGRPRVTSNIKLITKVCNTIYDDLCGNL